MESIPNIYAMVPYFDRVQYLNMIFLDTFSDPIADTK